MRDPQTSDVQERIFGATWLQEISGNWFQRLQFDYYNRLEDAVTPPILDQIPPTFSSQPGIDSDTDFKRARVQFALERLRLTVSNIEVDALLLGSMPGTQAFAAESLETEAEFLRAAVEGAQLARSSLA